MISAVKNTSNKDELELNARDALLQHFSSKSSNQVTNSLTIALIFFAFVMAIEPLKNLFGNWVIFSLNSWSFSSLMLCNILFAILLALIVALGFRTLSRLLYWAVLTGFVLEVEMASIERITEYTKSYRDEVLEERLKKWGYLQKKPELDSASWFMARLSLACYDRYRATYPKSLRNAIRYYGRKEFAGVILLISLVSTGLILWQSF